MQRLDVRTGLRFERSVGALHLHGGEIVDQLPDCLRRGGAVPFPDGLGDGVARFAGGEEIDAEAVLEVAGNFLRVGVERREVVFAQYEQGPARGILQQIAELAKEFTPGVESQRVGGEDFLELIEDEDYVLRGVAAAGTSPG